MFGYFNPNTCYFINSYAARVLTNQSACCVRVIFYMFSCMLASSISLFSSLFLFIDTIITGRELENWREWRASELNKDIKYCHPRWPQETKYLQSEIDAVRNLSLISSTDWWIYFDWITLVLVLASIGTHVAFFCYSTDVFKEIHHHTMIPLLMILWFRLFKYARPFESAGPFVVIFGNVMGDIAKWGFLNSIIIIPFTCAFWITFGAISLHPVDGYDSVGSLMYNIFSMMVVGDHQFPKLVEANPILSRFLFMHAFHRNRRNRHT